MILKLHPLRLASSNVTTCPEPPAPPSTNAARSGSCPAGTARAGPCRSFGSARPFSASPWSRQGFNAGPGLPSALLQLSLG